MLQWLVELSIRFRGVVLALAIALLGYGAFAARHAKLDVFPDFVQPQATIQTEAPGFSPEQVETLVTRVVEGAVAGMPRLTSLRSQSIEGLSIVSVFFEDGVDIFTIRQLLNEQLTAATGDLPQGVRTPRLTPLTSSTMDLLKIGLRSDRLSPMELREFADWTLRPRLQAVPGVAQVGVMGGDVRELQVQVLPDRLQAFGLALDDVLDAARRATGTRGAGYVETANQRIVLQSEGQSTTPEQLGAIVVKRSESADIRLRDVAHVQFAPQPKFGDVLIQGGPGVLVKLLSQYGANTMEVTRAAEEALDDLKPVFEKAGVEVVPRPSPATAVVSSPRRISRSLWIGAALVAVVLLLFLFNLRAALISILAIPLSLLTSVLVLNWMGLSLSAIASQRSAIAIRRIVDDAIIDDRASSPARRPGRRRWTERAFGRAGCFDRSAGRGSLRDADRRARIRAGSPALSGLRGHVRRPLGIACIAAILASLLVAAGDARGAGAILLPQVAERAWSRCSIPRIRRLRRPAAFIAVAGLVVASLATPSARRVPSAAGREFLQVIPQRTFRRAEFRPPGPSPARQRIGYQSAADLRLQQYAGNIRSSVRSALRPDAGNSAKKIHRGAHRAEFHIELLPASRGDQATHPGNNARRGWQPSRTSRAKSSRFGQPHR